MTEHMRRRLALSKTWIFGMCALLIGVIWMMVHERLAYERAQADDRARAWAANLALGFESRLQDLLNRVDTVLLVARHEYAGHAHVFLDEVIRSSTVDSTLLVSLMIVDPQGRLAAGTGAGLDPFHGEREYFTTLSASAGDPFHVGRLRRHPKGPWVLDVARRVSRPDGSFGGVVVASADVRLLGDFYKQTDLEGADSIRLSNLETSELLRIGAGGKVSVKEDQANRALGEALKANPDRGHFRTRGTKSGSPRLMTYRKLSDRSLIVMVSASEKDIHADVARDARLYYSIAGITSFALLVFAILLVRSLGSHNRALRQLLHNERRFRATFDQAFVGMALADAHGRPIQVNRRLCELLGRPEAEVLGRPILEFVHADDRPAETSQKRILLPDGSTAWAELSTTEVRDSAGRIECYLSVVQDITEFKRVDRMKSEFVSIVSHELRTPLTSIRGSLGLISGGVTGALPEAARGLVDIAKNNCERLIRLINDILDIEKIESGKMRFEMRDIQLVPLAERVVHANEAFAQQYGVRLRVEKTSEQPLLVNVDPDRLEQVLTNLISNAAKFAPRESEVTVRLGLCGDRARVEVIDRGLGIPVEFRSRIFHKFSQADSSDTRMKGGTGLGLNICKAIVERLGGMIGFTTAEGEGTTFFFELPELRTPETSARDASRPHVLVCEDDVDTARVIAMMLANAGYGTDIAHTLAQAREKLEAHRYDAMTVDIRLPDGNGLDLLAGLAHTRSNAGLPVVVVSAFLDESAVHVNGEALPVCDKLDKPIDESRLLRAIALGMEGRPRVLHVEPDRDVQCNVAAAAQELAAFDFASGVAEARERLTARRFDVVVLELDLEDGSGRDLLRDLSLLESPPGIVLLVHRPPSPAELRHADVVLRKGQALSSERIREAVAGALARRRQSLAA